MKKILVAIGDSWPAGAELDIPDYGNANYKTTHCFPSLVATQIGASECINLSVPGASLQHYFLQLVKFEEYKKQLPADTEFIFLVSMTSCVRGLYFDKHGNPMEIYPSNTKLFPFYAEIFNWPETPKYTWYTTVTLFQNYCQANNIKDFYVQMFDLPPKDDKYDLLINYNNIYCSAESSMLTYLSALNGENIENLYKLLPGPAIYGSNTSTYQTYFYPSHHHPNLLGHELIANEITKFILK